MIRRLLAALLLTAAPAFAQVPPQLDRLQRADGAHVVPDRFLRRWDPVTILFDTQSGPAGGGPEDAPERFVTLAPPKPGAWTWLGPKTLQFRPAEPWEPLRREVVTLGGAATTLVPLLPVPTATGPADASNGTADLDTIALQFDQPVDLAALARLLTVSLRPQAQPGGPAQVLTAQDFTLRPVERSGRGDRQTILVSLHQPIPDGQVATLRLRLSDEPGLDDPVFDLPLKSALPFRLRDTVCTDGYDHSTEDGVVRCSPSDPGKPRGIALQFSAPPETLSIVQARDRLRITPPVDDLAVKPGEDGALQVTGRFAADQVYSLAIAAGSLLDARGRALAEPVAQRFSFAPGTPALAWDVPQGIAERLGPQMVPLRGHGYDHADLRIHPVDPLSRDFWPFPRAGLATSRRHVAAAARQRARALRRSRPDRRRRHGGAHRRPRLAGRQPADGEPADPARRGGRESSAWTWRRRWRSIAGPAGAGHLPARAARGGWQRLRQWSRLQVTDLALTTVEEASHGSASR